jgi:hypothetical protein
LMKNANRSVLISWCTPKLLYKPKYEFEMKQRKSKELGHTLWLVALWG